MSTAEAETSETALLAIQQQLRTLFAFPEEEEPLAELLRRWRTLVPERVELDWESHGGVLLAWWRGFTMKIESGRARSRGMQLRFRWPGGGSRVVARGELAELKIRAVEICRSGGPHGGPHVVEDERPRPGRPRRRLHMTRFERLPTSERALVQGFGGGFEARVRPLSAHHEDDHALFLVSPAGSFVLAGFGPDYNLTPLANFWRNNLANDYASDLHDGDEPFRVCVRGTPLRFTHLRMPGFAGHVHAPIGDIFLCLLGYDDVALILVADDGRPQCLFRGTASAANGLELFPNEVPDRLLSPPRPFTPERVAEAIEPLPKLDQTIRRHVIALVRAARDEIGTEYARHLIWALVTAHARGHRTSLVGTHGEVFQWVLEQGYMRTPPKERAARGALHWLAARSPLFERKVVRRVAFWINHLEWLSDPSAACLARISEMSTATSTSSSGLGAH